MIARASFAISVLMSLASSVVLAALLVWPLLRNMPRNQALVTNPGVLGAAFFIPTAIVPPLLVTHGLVFLRLLA